LQLSVDRYRRLTVTVVIICLLMVAGGATAGWFLWNDQYQSCLAGNAFREGNQQIWDELFIISNAAHPPVQGSKEQREQQAFLAFVHRVDAPRECSGPPFS
jgi:hypothetical protein